LISVDNECVYEDLEEYYMVTFSAIYTRIIVIIVIQTARIANQILGANGRKMDVNPGKSLWHKTRTLLDGIIEG
jgi:hypothetical protein